jgi:hypothetical protein
MDTESFHISVLIEIGVVTTVSLNLDDSAVVLPKCGQDTRGVALVLELRMNEHKRSERWSRLETYPKVTVFRKVPRHITRMFPDGSVFVEAERCARIEEAGVGDVRREMAVRDERTCPSKPTRSPIVPTVKSTMRYMPLACIASMVLRQSSMVPQWGSRTDMSMGE